MAKNSSISNFRNIISSKVPKAFFSFCCSVIVVECVIAGFFPSIQGECTHSYIDTKVEIAKRANLNRDILILGDSAALMAIDPNRLYADTGLTSINLATVGRMTVVGNYYILKYYLQSNIAPRFVILMNNYDIWPRDLGAPLVSQVLATHFTMEMIKALGDTELMGEEYASLLQEIGLCIFPSYRYKWEIRRMAGDMMKEWRTLPELLEKNRQDRLYMEQQALGKTQQHFDYGDKLTWPKMIASDLESHMQYIRENEFRVSKMNTHYLEKSIVEAEKKGITVFISFPPIIRELYDDDIGNEHLGLCRTFLENVASSHDSVFLLTKDFYVVTADRLLNSVEHLTREESLVYTDMLAEKILQFMDRDG